MYRGITVIFLMISLNPLYAKVEEAIFAGGCFWCVEADFDKVPGVLNTVAGFDGGNTPDPTYLIVSSGKTHYAESVRITFDNNKISYKALVNYFWHHIDPTAYQAQFCDKGRQYRSAIFYLNAEQKQVALASKKELEKKFSTVYTEIVPSTHFYAAEGYHQNYYKKNPIRYKFYRYRCGRDQRLEELWKK